MRVTRLPGACFSVTLGLQGAEVPPEIVQLDLGALRAGLVVVEVCDAGDGRADGVLIVGGAVANAMLDITVALAAPDVDPALVQHLEGLTLTIDLIQTRSPDSEGGAPSGQHLPQIAMTLADLGSGERVRVVYGVSNTPVTLSPDETPSTSDGTGIID